MSLSELQTFTFTQKYARWLKEEKRRETWKESNNRVEQMMVDAYEGLGIDEDITQSYDLMLKKRVLGSQRALQFGGSPVFKHNARIYNCIASYVDRVKFFQECMYLLLCGCGTGYSVQQHHIDKLPDLVKSKKGSAKYVIPDTIEGWADAVGVLVASYFRQSDLYPEYVGKAVHFDYSKIRKEGAYLASSGGKAPGPAPLKEALSNMKRVLDGAMKRGDGRMLPIEAMDIVCHSADAVLSGGVRRSACICIFSASDDLMMNAKTGNWLHENPQRGRVNISVLLLRGEVSYEQFCEQMEKTKQYGEPGFVWSDSTELIVNPCLTKDTTITTANGLELVENLIDKPFMALVDGDIYNSRKGFWKTGEKEVLELEFKSGRTLKVTGNHKIMTVHGWKEAQFINSEDEVVIHNHRSNDLMSDVDDFYFSAISSKEYCRGYCLGNFLGDGNVSKGSAEMKWWGLDKEKSRKDGLDILEGAEWKNKRHKEAQDSESSYSTLSSRELFNFANDKGCVESNKHLSKKAICGTWEYLSGLVAGYFDADGTVLFNTKKGSSLRITSCQLENLRNLQIILNAFGIYSKIYNDRSAEGYRDLPNGNGGTDQYYCQATHELCISCDNIQQFYSKIPIRNPQKLEKIKQIVDGYKRTPNRTHFVDKLINKTSIGFEDVYDTEVDDIHAFDANSIYVHNCVEIGLYPVDIVTGLTGWQACNLSTINCGKLKTEEDFYECCKAAATIGTLQAGFTSIPYLGPVTEEILKRESLLGVSMTGMMQSPDICLDPKIQRKGARIIKETNRRIAKAIGINPAARTTCIKPEGTTSCVLGVSSGIHPNHAKRYFRLVQANKNDNVYKYFKEKNPLACAESVWSKNDSDDVITFCIEVEDGAKLKNQVDAITLLEYVKSTQQNWVMEGKNTELCVHPWLCHNVSNTITVKPEEWDGVSKYIYKNRKYFCGISLLPISGDKDYPQAPFSAVYLPSEMTRHYGDGAMFVSGLIVEGQQAFEDDLWVACDAALGLGSKIKGTQKKNWVVKMQSFADKYMAGDVRKTTYCLKDVSNWKRWCDLNREYQTVNYKEFVEENDGTSFEAEPSCAGGACEI